MTRVGRLYLLADPELAAAECLATPVPAGSGAGLRSVATQLARTAAELRDALARLRRVAELDATWSGAAARSFVAAAREPGNSHLDEVPARYEGYARALREYATALDAAQHDLVPLRGAVARALDAVHAERAAGSAGDGAARECGRAARRFADRYDQWARAANGCVAALNHVDRHDHLHNPHGWHALVDEVAKWSGDLSTVCTVLAMVAVPLCPPAAALLFAAGTVAGAAGLGADLDRKFQYGEDVGIGTLAVDALGCVQSAGLAKSAVSAVAAARNVGRGAGRLAASRAAFGRTLSRHARDGWTKTRDAAVELVRDPAHGLRTPEGRRIAVEELGAAASIGESAAADAWDRHAKEPGKGWWDPVWRAPFRVLWGPVDDVLPTGAVRTAVEVADPVLAGLRPAAEG